MMGRYVELARRHRALRAERRQSGDEGAELQRQAEALGQRFASRQPADATENLLADVERFLALHRQLHGDPTAARCVCDRRLWPHEVQAGMCAACVDDRANGE
jgi:hypothetical protein